MEFVWGFMVIAGITYFTAMLPGPDMAVVLKNSLLRSKKDGIITALGIVTGNAVYVALALAGLGVVITQSVVLFSILKYLGAAYIIYLGIKLLFSKSESLEAQEEVPPRSSQNAFREGLLTNLGNPKFLLFLFGIFTQVIEPSTPLVQQVVYGAVIPVFAFLSFSTIALVAGSSTVKSSIASKVQYVEKIMGVALIALGIKVVVSVGE